MKEILSEEDKNEAMDLLEEILQENADIKLGFIQRDKLLEFIDKKIGTKYYNRGVRDAAIAVESCQEVFEERLDQLIQYD